MLGDEHVLGPARTLGQVGRELDARRAMTRRQARTYDDDRVCERPGCITILSRTNPGPLCRIHSRPQFDEADTARPGAW